MGTIKLAVTSESWKKLQKWRNFFFVHTSSFRGKRKLFFSGLRHSRTRTGKTVKPDEVISVKRNLKRTWKYHATPLPSRILTSNDVAPKYCRNFTFVMKIKARNSLSNQQLSTNNRPGCILQWINELETFFQETFVGFGESFWKVHNWLPSPLLQNRLV